MSSPANQGSEDHFEEFRGRARCGGRPRRTLVTVFGEVVVRKGIVMRPEALRAATAKAAAEGSTKLNTRLSKGEKRNRKRMAEVASVHDITPVPRSPADILPGADVAGQATPSVPSG